MSTNFLNWNPTETNQETDAEYAADSQRSGGAPANAVFPSPTANKLFFQTSAMAFAIAKFIAQLTGAAVLDNGATLLIEQLAQAVNTSAFYGTSGGSANAQTITPNIYPTAYVTGLTFTFLAGATNTGATTINVSGLGAIEVLKQAYNGLVPLEGGEFYAGQIYTLTFDGTYFQIVNSPSAPYSIGGYTGSNYFKIPGTPFLVQWGYVDFGTLEAYADVLLGPYDFTTQFPNGCLGMQFTALNPAAGNSIVPMVPQASPPSTSQFYVWMNNITAAGYGTANIRGFTWVAFGY